MVRSLTTSHSRHSS